MSKPEPVIPPLQPPVTALAWEAWVTVSARQALGRSPLGERYIIPITGGRFEGPRGLKGRVLPGGADRQLWRTDGVRELDALYEMQHDDGSVFTIRNRVLIHETVQGGRYALSQVAVTAPEGPHDWLNRRIFVGTLHPQPPERQEVLIRVWRVEAR